MSTTGIRYRLKLWLEALFSDILMSKNWRW